MNTRYQDGKRIPHLAGSNLSSGALVIIRSGASGLCGVLVADIASGATGAAEICGVHKITAETGAWANGDVLYRHATNGTLTTASTNNTRAGTAIGAKTTAATVGYVLLNDNPG